MICPDCKIPMQIRYEHGCWVEYYHCPRCGREIDIDDVDYIEEEE